MGTWQWQNSWQSHGVGRTSPVPPWISRIGCKVDGCDGRIEEALQACKLIVLIVARVTTRRDSPSFLATLALSSIAFATCTFAHVERCMFKFDSSTCFEAAAAAATPSTAVPSSCLMTLFLLIQIALKRLKLGNLGLALQSNPRHGLISDIPQKIGHNRSQLWVSYETFDAQKEYPLCFLVLPELWWQCWSCFVLTHSWSAIDSLDEFLMEHPILSVLNVSIQWLTSHGFLFLLSEGGKGKHKHLLQNGVLKAHWQ